MKNLAALAAACACALGSAFAQTPPAPERPIVRTSATEVLLDVSVTDKHGKPVKNLKQSDLEVYEDEVRQPVTSFRFVSASEAQQLATRAAAAGGQPAESRTLHSVSLVCLVFHNLDPVARVRAIEVARDFLRNELPPDTYIGMFTLDDRLTAVHAFTKDRHELSQAVGTAFSAQPLDFVAASVPALTANPTMVTIVTVTDAVNHTSSTTMEVTGGEIANTVVTGAEVGTDYGSNVMRGLQVTENRDFSNINGMRETDKIINMVTQFGRLPGHKLVLLLTTGLSTTGDPDRFDSIVAKANENHITIDAIDVAGLTDQSTAQAADLAVGQVAAVSRTQTAIGGSLAAAKEKSRQGDTLNDAVRNSDVQAALRALADGTGGTFIANTNEFRKPMQRIADDLETHYELTYRPTATLYDGRLRSIKVRVASHPDWRVESRLGYFAMPALGEAPLSPFETVGLALLASKPLPHAFPVHSGVFTFRGEGDNRQAALVVEIPGAALGEAANPARHSHMLHPQVFALVRDSSGQIVDKYSLDAPYEIPDSKLAEFRSMPLVYTHPLDLPPGKYTAETIAMDRTGGRSSTSVTSFEATAPAGGLGMSSALLIRRLEPGASKETPLAFHGQKLVPFVDANLSAQQRPYAYFVVYPNRANKAKPRVSVEFTVDGRMVANQAADLPAPDATGAIPMVIRAAVHNGKCELKITAMQGSESTTRTLAYDVR
jgi:VWFA-related protein